MTVVRALRTKLSSALRQLRGRSIGRYAARHALVGRPELWEMKRQFQIDFLRAQGLKSHHRLIDIGCGTLRGGLPIIAYLEPGNYFGIETRSVALQEARRELREADLEHKRPTLIQSSDFSIDCSERHMHYAWAFSVLIHFEDEILTRCLASLARLLIPSGIFFANVKIGDKATEHWEEFPVVSRSLDFYRKLGGRHGLELEDLGELSEHGHISGIVDQDSQRMLAFRRCST